MDLFYAVAGPGKMQQDPPGGDGHVEGVPQLDAQGRSTRRKPAILYDKFHVLRHLDEALDKVRKSEYARLSGKDRRFIKGQKYTLLSRWENLTPDGRRSAEAAVQGQQTIEQGLPAQGVVRPAVGLQAGRLGAALLRATGAPP